MNILLTGGTGYIGSHTALTLMDAGHCVVLLDNFSNSSRSVLDRLEKITGKIITFIEADIRDTKQVILTLKEYQIESVIHFAGLKAVGESIEKPLEYFDNNIGGTISLLVAMQEASVRTLVFSSSATVYGEPQYLPINEDHPTSATNPYGRTKLHIEEMLKDMAFSNADWRITSLRYFNPVGAPNNLMPYVAQVAAGKLECLNIYGDDYSTADGTGVRDYIHVMDLAYGHFSAINFLSQNAGYHVFNLGTGVGFSVLQMVRAFERVVGRQIKYKIVSRRAGDVAACYADPNKARRLLGWEPRLTLNEMCETVWQWQSKV